MAANMAAVEDSGGRMIIESVINRWILDYYTSVAISAFRNGNYGDFCEIRDILQNLLVRPLESTDVTPIKIQILQFLSRINDGDRLDCCFESMPATPLESAIVVLNSLDKDLNIGTQNLEKVRKSIREMLVIVCIKNKRYDKAKEALTKYFPKSMVGKKAIFMGLINKKINKHVVLEQVTYEQFREEMVQFCESLISETVPFLSRVAKQLIEGRKAAEKMKNPTEREEGVDLTQPPADKPDTSATPGLQLRRAQILGAYTALAKELGEAKSFTQLENEVEKEVRKGKKKESGRFSLCLSPSPLEGSDAEPESEDPSQRDSGSPMEAFQAEQFSGTVVEVVPTVQEDPLVEVVPTVQEDIFMEVQEEALVEVVPTVQQDPLVEVVPTVQEEALVEVVPMVQEEALVEVVPTVQEEALVEVVPTVQEEDLVEVVPMVQQEALVEVVPIVQEESLVEVVPIVQEEALVEVVPTLQEEALVEVVPSAQQVPVEKKCRKPHSMARLVMEPDSQTSQQEAEASEQEPPVVEPEEQAGPSTSLEDPLSSQPTCKTPTRKHRKRPASREVDGIPSGSDVDVCTVDDSSDGSPHKPAQKSSTPQKNRTPLKGDPPLKWKKLLNHAKGVKTTWTEEDSLFNTPFKAGSSSSSSSKTSGGKRRVWTTEETEWLRKGVARFGEGHWEQIRTAYPFGDRTSVNIKDRWRTMKKLNIA